MKQKLSWTNIFLFETFSERGKNHYIMLLASLIAALLTTTFLYPLLFAICCNKLPTTPENGC